MRLLALLRVSGLARDQPQHRLVQGEGRLQNLLQFSRTPQTGELLKQLMHIIADRLVAGKQTIVRVQARSAGVIVAGAQVHVTPQPLTLAPQHQNHLGVRLITHHAVHDMRAGVLQPGSDVDIFRLVKTRTQLHHHRHLLPRAGGGNQHIRQGRIGTGTIQRLLDRQHIRIFRRLADKIHYRGKRLERMVEQHITAPDHTEYIGRLFNPARHARRKGRIFQIGPLHRIIDRQQAIQIHRPGHLIQVILMQRELLYQVMRHLIRTIIGHLQTHCVAVLPGGQLALQRQTQILDLLLLHKQITVARQAKLKTARGLHAGEQLAHMRMNDGGKKHKVVRPLGVFLGKVNQARQRARRLHHRDAAAAPKGILAFQRNNKIKAFIEHARKRVQGVQPEWAQHRQQLVGEVTLNPGYLTRFPLRASHKADILLRQFWDDSLVEQAVLLGDQAVRGFADALQRLRRADVVRPRLHRPIHHLLLQTRDANLEKLVEVGAANAQKLEPLQ